MNYWKLVLVIILIIVVIFFGVILYIRSMKKVREKFDSNKTIIDKIEEFVDNYFDEDL